jgi:hypothetical protein
LGRRSDMSGLTFHALFGTHIPDHRQNHWEGSDFASACATCGRPMIKAPGGRWMLAISRSKR